MEPIKTPHGYRFFGSVESFVYSNPRLRPSWEPEADYRLTEEHRHQLCLHLAAHAAISSLGCSRVFMLAVPRAGVRSWTIGERKNANLGQHWGICSVSDFYCSRLQWDRTNQRFLADRDGWEQDIAREYEYLTAPRDRKENIDNVYPNGAPTLDRVRAERRRMVRSHVCGYLAGHIVDGITAGMTAEDALNLYDRRDSQYVGASDIVVAQGLAGLLPTGEYENAVRITEDALRRTEVFDAVTQAANGLEEFGLVENDECEVNIESLLPASDYDWPPAPGQPIGMRSE
jgi:hypothetical protein